MSSMQFFQDNRETVEQNACVSVLCCSPKLSTAIGRRVIKAENSRDTSALLTNKYAARHETLYAFFHSNHGSQTRGQRATCCPRMHLVWSADTIGKFSNK